MGAPRKNFLAEHHQTWRLFTFPFLHAGVFHLVINLCSVIYAGIHLEQEFGPLRIGIIYILSAFVGALVASLFLQNIPVVGASGALFGLLGTLLSELVWNKKFHNNKITEIASLVFVFVCNFLLGFLPYVVNFSNIGGFISGFLLGTVLLLSPQFQQVAPSKGDQIDYSLKSYMLKFKQKPDRSVTRIVSLILFTMLLAGCLVAVHYGINIKGEDQLCWGVYDEMSWGVRSNYVWECMTKCDEDRTSQITETHSSYTCVVLCVERESLEDSSYVRL
ncbi:unnamed protein product [Trifolium pratense]|uniref:Uncharacterized protein n=1 Tax=Trifolium pratense TaxID=57577 RepID=A0ACB0M707_TRIPR|nr:unnamed protein product [Trifolium pratense]